MLAWYLTWHELRIYILDDGLDSFEFLLYQLKNCQNNDENILFSDINEIFSLPIVISAVIH